LTVLFLIGLAFLVSLTQPKIRLDDTAVLDVKRTLPAHILCSPNSSQVQNVINKALEYLEHPHPELSFYHTAAKAEKAYLDITTGAHANNSQVIGIDFDELAVPSSARYSLRYRDQDVADTTALFNHERKCVFHNICQGCIGGIRGYMSYINSHLFCRQ